MQAYVPVLGGSNFRWSFAGAEGGSVGPVATGGDNTWTGPMVESGQVSVLLNVSGFSDVPARPCNVVVNPRTGFETPQMQISEALEDPSKWANALPRPPLIPSDLGSFAPVDAGGLDNVGDPIEDGPNTGYYYIIDIPVSVPYYRINPDLTVEPHSSFFNMQCNDETYMSGEEVLAGTERHEYNHLDYSHLGFANTLIAMNTEVTNYGVYSEDKFVAPNQDLADWFEETRAGLDTIFNYLDTQGATAGHNGPNNGLVYPVNYDITLNPPAAVRTVNFPPYSGC